MPRRVDIVEVQGPEGIVTVSRPFSHCTDYEVRVNGVLKHAGDCDVAIRALGHYLEGTTHRLNKALEKKGS